MNDDLFDAAIWSLQLLEERQNEERERNVKLVRLWARWCVRKVEHVFWDKRLQDEAYDICWWLEHDDPRTRVRIATRSDNHARSWARQTYAKHNAYRALSMAARISDDLMLDAASHRARECARYTVHAARNDSNEASDVVFTREEQQAQREALTYISSLRTRLRSLEDLRGALYADCDPWLIREVWKILDLPDAHVGLAYCEEHMKRMKSA